MYEEYIANAKTPKELYDIIKEALDGGVDLFDYYYRLIIRQAAIKIRRAILTENPSLDIPPVGSGYPLETMDWCTTVEKVVSESIAWSKVMPKDRIAVYLGEDTVRKLNTRIEAGIYEVRQQGTREQWQVRTDKLTPELQKKLQN